MIPCPQQPPTRIGKTVSGANAVLSSLAPPAALAAGQRIVLGVDVSVSAIYMQLHVRFSNVVINKSLCF